MRCRKSQNREHKRDGASGYSEDHNAVVSKKHGVHHGLSILFLERRGRSPNFSHIGTIRDPLMCSSRHMRNPKNLWPAWLGSTTAGEVYGIHPTCGGDGTRVVCGGLVHH